MSAALRANVLSGDSLGQMVALMQVPTRLAVALIQEVPGVAALMIAVHNAHIVQYLYLATEQAGTYLKSGPV